MLLEIKCCYVARAHLVISLSVFASSEVTTCIRGSEVYFLIEEHFPPRELKVYLHIYIRYTYIHGSGI